MTQTYSPIKSIRIQNYQSLEDVTLDLGRLTVLVGQGDVGKSAVLRAIRAVVLNDMDDLDIRHGAKKTEVTLTFEDGTTIEWYKEKGKGGCYRMTDSNPERVFTKTGGQVPDEIAEYLGIVQIEVDASTTLTPQLSDQHDQPFILWLTGSQRARILGKATRLDMVVTAQMLCKKRLDAHRRELETQQKLQEETEVALAGIPDHQRLASKVSELEANLQCIQHNQDVVAQARRLGEHLVEVRSRATAIDTAPVRKQVEATVAQLERAIQFQTLRTRLYEVSAHRDDLQGQYVATQSRLEELKVAYSRACVNAGVCVVCGGLQSHEECRR